MMITLIVRITFILSWLRLIPRRIQQMQMNLSQQSYIQKTEESYKWKTNQLVTSRSVWLRTSPCFPKRPKQYQTVEIISNKTKTSKIYEISNLALTGHPRHVFEKRHVPYESSFHYASNGNDEHVWNGWLGSKYDKLYFSQNCLFACLVSHDVASIMVIKVDTMFVLALEVWGRVGDGPCGPTCSTCEGFVCTLLASNMSEVHERSMRVPTGEPMRGPWELYQVSPREVHDEP